MGTLRLRLLGRPVVELDGIDVTRRVATKHQALLFFLAAGSEPVARSQLAPMLWGALDEQAARGNLRVALSKLRVVCGEALNIDAQQVELVSAVRSETDFAELVGAGRAVAIRPDQVFSADWPYVRLVKAVERRRSVFLDGFAVADSDDYENWLRWQRQYADRETIAVRRYLADRSEALGNQIALGDAIAHLRSIIHIDEADESAHMQLMSLLAATGQRMGAIAQYEICKAALARKLGAKPSAECYALYARIHSGRVANELALPVEVSTGRASALPGATGEGDATSVLPKGGRSVPEPLAFQRFVNRLTGETEADSVARKASQRGVDHVSTVRESAPALVEISAGPALSTALRLREREWLRQAYTGVTVLEGEPGMGKSTLLGQAFPDAGWLRCRESLTGLPLHPLIDFLRRHREHLDSRAGINRSELARLVPEFLVDDPLPMDAALGKARLFGALYSAVHAVCGVLVVDDLQWADASTLEWLAYAIEQRDLQVVLAHRVGEQTEEWQRLARSLSGDGRLRRLKLAPLDDAAMVQLLCDAAQSVSAGNPLVNQALRLAGGNPFYGLELMRRQEGESDIGAVPEAISGSTPHVVPSVALNTPIVPGRVQHHIEARLQHLASALRGLLEVLAVADEMWLPAAALATLADLELSDFEESLVQLQARAWIAGQRFAHDLLRQCVYASLAARRRAHLHRSTARAAVRASESGWVGQQAQIARHFRAAGDVDQALDFEFLAAQHVRELGGFDESVKRFSDIAHVASDPVLKLRCRAAVAEHLLLSDLSAGKHALEEVLIPALALPKSPSQRELLVRIRTGLADNAIYRGDIEGAGAHIELLMPLIDGIAPAERLHALEIVIDVAMRRGEYAKAHHALRLARRVPGCGAVFDISEAMLASSELRIADAVAGFEKILRNSPDHARYLMVENDCAVAHILSGHVVAAESWLRRSLVTWAGVPHAECLAKLNLGSVLSSAGRWGEARDVLDQALALARDQHSGLFEGETLHRLGRLSTMSGRVVEGHDYVLAAIDCLDTAMDPVRVGQWHASAVALSIAAGKPDQADRHMRACRDLLGQVDRPLPALRLARAQLSHDLSVKSPAVAMESANRVLDVSRHFGLDEITAETLLLLARCVHSIHGAEPASQLALQAADIARSRELLPLSWRALGMLATWPGGGPYRESFLAESDALVSSSGLQLAELLRTAAIEPTFDCKY